MRVLDDEPDVVLHAAAVEAQSVRQEAELHCAVGAAGEDVIGRAGLDLHDTCAQITEERLTSVFITEGVQEALGGHAPHLTHTHTQYCYVTYIYLYKFTKLK